MKKITIVGGKLQGLEACYLGMKADIEVTLIDKDPQAPAKDMAAHFICADVLGGSPEVMAALDSADMVLPTMENYQVLEGLNGLSAMTGFIYAFDMDAYRISSSKKRSDKLFYDNKVEAPRYYPEGSAPYIAKPDGQSGSHGVRYFETEKETEEFAASHNEMIIQEFLEGPSYSIEVIGEPGNYRAYEITQIHIDDIYDCNKVTAPCDITQMQAEEFVSEAKRIASIIRLKGIMDFEVIDSGGRFRMLEIDARLPSQTPTVVYHSSGTNFIEELYDLFVRGDFRSKKQSGMKYTAFEHMLVSGRDISSPGEHVMTEGSVLDYKENYLGSDEVITDRDRNTDTFRMTFINTAETEELVSRKREGVLACLKNTL